MRFNACALRVLDEEDDLTIGGVHADGYSTRFVDDYLIVSFLLPSVLLIISHWFIGALRIIAVYDGRGVGSPNRYISGKPSWLTIKDGQVCGMVCTGTTSSF